MTIEAKSTSRKSNTLGLYKIGEGVSVLTIAEALKDHAFDINAITISTRRNNIRSVQLAFSSIEACDIVKKLNTLTLDGQEYDLQYAHSKPASMNLSASTNKVYVKYPSSANFDEVAGLFKDVEIKKPENATNYFFATCKDMDMQCDLVKKFDQLQVSGGLLNVKVAIERAANRPRSHKENSIN